MFYYPHPKMHKRFFCRVYTTNMFWIGYDATEDFLAMYFCLYQPECHRVTSILFALKNINDEKNPMETENPFYSSLYVRALFSKFIMFRIRII